MMNNLTLTYKLSKAISVYDETIQSSIIAFQSLYKSHSKENLNIVSVFQGENTITIEFSGNNTVEFTKYLNSLLTPYVKPKVTFLNRLKQIFKGK